MSLCGICGFRRNVGFLGVACGTAGLEMTWPTGVVERRKLERLGHIIHPNVYVGVALRGRHDAWHWLRILEPCFLCPGETEWMHKKKRLQPSSQHAVFCTLPGSACLPCIRASPLITVGVAEKQQLPTVSVILWDSIQFLQNVSTDDLRTSDC